MQVSTRPVGYPIGGSVAPQAPAPVMTAQPTPVAANMAPAPTVTVAGVLDTVKSLLSGLFNFFKGLFSKLSTGPITPVTPGPTPGTTPGTTPTGESDAELAARFGLLNTPENVANFRTTLARQQAEVGVLAPGSTNTASVKELQMLLSAWGFNAPATGQFDATTAEAVMAWKAANGLTENFQFADGRPGVTPLVDLRARDKMVQLLTGTTSPGTGTTSPGTGSQLSAADQALADANGLLATPANLEAYKTAIANASGEANVVGPDRGAPEAVSEIQDVLRQLGFSVTVTGQFDAATAEAVMSFKRTHGLTESYQLADGSPGVTPYVTAATVDKLVQAFNEAPAQQQQQAQAAPGALTPEQQAIAQQAGIQATAQNIEAFKQAAAALEAQQAMGPGVQETPEAVGELQQLLTSWGYAAPTTGKFDQATVEAVLKFKRDNGLTEAYLMADGTPGVHPFIDQRTKDAMIAKLSG